MLTISPDEAIAIAKRIATSFEAEGGTDPKLHIDQFFSEIEPVLANPEVDRSEYLSAVASKIKLEVASPDPDRARRSGLFAALHRAISARLR